MPTICLTVFNPPTGTPTILRVSSSITGEADFAAFDSASLPIHDSLCPIAMFKKVLQRFFLNRTPGPGYDLSSSGDIFIPSIQPLRRALDEQDLSDSLRPCDGSQRPMVRTFNITISYETIVKGG